ncbi:AraC family transcriptional regulator [Solwaraspora sp. WMMD1047]|uniref:AraC family transcriptional regulator n=1 Tax=Solwaraspora sp. WMMD1047 TaxID=3016102 RepID=UPI002416F24B|nr:AraC family transcriptional regulator [Solwaraspora sp. WMMD1047]MDG4831125.1 AraC family transcriptional regulator [Solwaraspora sp. WMMD1047]
MDPLTGLLDGPRARGAFLLRTVLDPPWSLRIRDRAPLSLMTMIRGTGWLVRDGEPPLRFAPGDVVIARGPDPYTVADEPGTAPQVIVEPGQRCTAPDGSELTLPTVLGVRTWGHRTDGETVLLTGTYQLDGEISGRLLGALPATLLVPDGPWNGTLVPLLNEEIVRDTPGQEVVLDRLLDLLLVAALRVWFAEAGAAAPGWYRALDDPVVGRALRGMQSDPAHPWTVATLAAHVGVSRAALARRFTDLVGEPPMAFLTGWRLDLAADLLTEPDATVGSVARKVGYGSGFALSAAFKRVRGTSPQQYRAAQVLAGAG